MTRAEELADAAMGGPDDPLTAEQIAAISELAADAEALAEALDWIEAEPEDPLKVQARARAALARHRGEKP